MTISSNYTDFNYLALLRKHCICLLKLKFLAYIFITKFAILLQFKKLVVYIRYELNSFFINLYLFCFVIIKSFSF